MQTIRRVPPGYIDTNLKSFTIPREKSYTGPAGGGHVGPSSAVTQACSSRSLYDLFSFFIDKNMIQNIVKQTNTYGNGHWVRPVGKEEY